MEGQTVPAIQNVRPFVAVVMKMRSWKFEEYPLSKLLHLFVAIDTKELLDRQKSVSVLLILVPSLVISVPNFKLVAVPRSHFQGPFSISKNYFLHVALQAVSSQNLVPRKNDLRQADKSIFLGVNHSCAGGNDE